MTKTEMENRIAELEITNSMHLDSFLKCSKDLEIVSTRVVDWTEAYNSLEKKLELANEINETLNKNLAELRSDLKEESSKVDAIDSVVNLVGSRGNHLATREKKLEAIKAICSI